MAEPGDVMGFLDELSAAIDRAVAHRVRLERKLAAIRAAADNLLAPVAAETCRLWSDEPGLDVVPYLVAAKVELPGALWQALFDATADD